MISKAIVSAIPSFINILELYKNIFKLAFEYELKTNYHGS